MKKLLGLEKLGGYPRTRVIKAIELYENGKVSKQGRAGESIYFTVNSNSPHEVIYRIRQNQFLCDCRHFAMKGSQCSHILAVRLFMENSVKASH